MLIIFHCGNCRSRLEIDARAAENVVSCPTCGTSLYVPRPQVGPGTTIGGFRVTRLLGIGGMGEVYLARQLSMDRDVALKILPSRPDRSRAEADRFLHEARLLARLEHPNVVTAHEAGEDDGILFLAMAYVKGESVAARMATHGAMHEKDALKITRKVGRALAYAWEEHRLLHRDVKPSNILLDAHGEPKLVDLGLAQTLTHQGRPDEQGRAMGTPNYMSPEQAEGRVDVDFRTDIYALGATLYHMVTGQLPFSGGTPEETLRRKLDEPLPDPRTYVPSLSSGMVAVMAHMLERNPAERYQSWDELIVDLDRLLAGRPPLAVAESGAAADHGAAHKVRITAKEAEALRATHVQSKPRPLAIAGGIAAAVMAAVLGYVVLSNLGNADRSADRSSVTNRIAHGTPPPATGATNAVTPAQARAEKERRLLAEFAGLRASEATNAASRQALLQRLRALRLQAEGMNVARRVDAEIARLMAEHRQAVDQAFAALEAITRSDIEIGDFEGAVHTFEGYTGPYAAETEARRQEAAADLRRRGAEAAAKRIEETERALAAMRQNVAEILLKGDWAGARTAFEQGCLAARRNPDDASLAAWKDVISKASRMKELVLAAFQADVGNTVDLTLMTGVESWEIRGLQGDRIDARRPVGGGFVARTISYEELHPAEKFKRLEGVPAPAREILRGMLALQVGNAPSAVRAFESTGEEVGKAMASAVTRMLRKSAESAAERSFEQLLRRAGVTPAATPNDTAAAIRRSRFMLADVTAIRAAAAEFRKQYGPTDLAATNAAVLTALEKAATYPREVDPAVLDQALRALAEANAITGRLNRTTNLTEDGLDLAITGHPQLVNISALSALPLVRLSLAGCGVRDFSSLRNMPLQSLDLSGCAVSDLSSLKSVPIRELNLTGCNLDSLSSLRGMSLESLNITSNRVATLTPLQGMPLKKLVMRSCGFDSLRALQGMPLESLDLTACPKVGDLRVLADLPLKSLRLSYTGPTDLSPLASCPLEELRVAACELTRLDPLKGMRLKYLDVSANQLRDLTSLAGMPLEVLNASSLPHLDAIAPLQGMPLRRLYLAGTAVRDLSPLKGMPLEHLDLQGTAVRDLSPLAGMPLTVLYLGTCERVDDLSPLAACAKLETLTIPRWTVPLAPLKGLTSLKLIGLNPDRLREVSDVWDRLEPRAGAEEAAPGPGVTPAPRSPSPPVTPDPSRRPAPPAPAPAPVPPAVPESRPATPAPPPPVSAATNAPAGAPARP